MLETRRCQPRHPEQRDYFRVYRMSRDLSVSPALGRPPCRVSLIPGPLQRRNDVSSHDFDAELFEERLSQFRDDVMPAAEEPLTTEEMSNLFVEVREFLCAQHMPPPRQIEFAQLLLGPLLRALPYQDRITLAPKWFATFGSKCPFLH